MAAPWTQQPRQQYPLAEYFALAPDRFIALGPRLSLKAGGTLQTVPAGTTLSVTQDLPMLPSFGYGDAVFIVRMFVVYFPNDASQELQVVGQRMGLGTGAQNIFMDLGIPLLSFLSPANTQQMLSDAEVLFTFHDLQSVGFGPVNGPLIMSTLTAVHNNDPTNAHQFAILPQVVFHSLKGFVE